MRKGIKKAIVAGALVWQSQTFYSPEDSTALLECLSPREQMLAKIVLVPLPEPQGYYYDGVDDKPAVPYNNLWTMLYRDSLTEPRVTCETDHRNNCVAVTCNNQ